jgi:negative regulator of flagellin synthesis FlgM
MDESAKGNIVKINSAITSVGTSAAGSRAKSPAKAAQESPIQSGEQVALSSLSARLQEASAALAETPVVDAARVAEIKQAIAEGRFHVNPERIADGLLENVRQMLAKQR